MTMRAALLLAAISHTAAAMAAGKELMIVGLAKGMGPGDVAETLGLGRSTVYEWKREDPEFAEMLGLGRSTVYEWKREDPEFDAKWVEAVETSLDKLETVSYNLALGGDPRMIEWNLKWRRRGTYNDSEESRRAIANQTNYFLNAPLEEHYQTLERLGLPARVIEPDYEVIDAADSDKDNP
jgi:predicted DNA-binding transcriptional regulator AlpA